MTQKVTLALVALITVLLAMDVFGHTESWAYDIISPADSDLNWKLSQMGLDGYELVSARRASDSNQQTPTARYEMIFKRRLGFFEAAIAKHQQAGIKAQLEDEVQRRIKEKR